MPGLNTWTFIFVIASVQGLFMSAVLLFRKERHPSRRFLALILLLFSLILLEYTLFWTGYEFYFPYLVAWSNCYIFLFGPLFYLYFRSVFIKTSLSKKDLLHGLVFLAAVLQASPFLFAPTHWKQDLMLKKLVPAYNYFMLYPWLGIAHMSLYLVIIFRSFGALSRTEQEVRKWFRLITGFFALFIASYASYFVLSRFSFFNPQWDYAISFSMLLFIYFISWFGYLHPKVFSGFHLLEREAANTQKPEIKEEVKYKNSPASGETGQEIARHVEAIMSSQKLYLQNDISLDKLAAACGFSKHYISQAINEQLDMNFFEYINKLRIAEARQLLLKPKEQLTIIEVAYQVGYNNKASFNKAFKTITGLTPTEYRAGKTAPGPAAA